MIDRTMRATLLAAVALLAAALLGGSAGYALGRRPPPMRMKEPALLGVTRAMFDSLGLDPTQRARIDSTLDATESRAERAIRTMMAEVSSLTNDARKEVRATLHDGQREQFDRMLARARPALPRSPLPPRDSSRTVK